MNEWSNDELKAAVSAYLKMLSLERRGETYSKSEVNKGLRQGSLFGRSKGSIEYRMQNISAALEELCLPWIPGYKPARNLGVGVKDRIRQILVDEGAVDDSIFEPTNNLTDLRKKVARLRSEIGRSITNGKPRGRKSPAQINSSSCQFERDPLVRAWVLETAEGSCEACGEAAPFVDAEGIPFLEVHHVLPLADGGPDIVENAIAVCPNCHRRLHYGADKAKLKCDVIRKIGRVEAF